MLRENNIMLRLFFFAVIFFIISYILRIITNYLIRNKAAGIKNKPDNKPNYDKSKIVDAEFEEIK